MTWRVLFDESRVNYEISFVIEWQASVSDMPRYMIRPEFDTVPRTPSTRVPESCIWTLNATEADAMLAAFAQAAWDRGWRPTHFARPETSAQQRHLEDKQEEVRWLRDRFDAALKYNGAQST